MKTLRIVLWIILFPAALFTIVISILSGLDWEEIKQQMIGD